MSGINEIASSITAGKPRRRVRYHGTHPRRFHEKYKELAPDRYSADVEKVLASGKTPAGMHRPVCVQEILEVLVPKAGEVAVDCTLGYGGHATELLKAIQPEGRLIALDVDPIEVVKAEARLRLPGLPEGSLVVRRMNFAGLASLLAQEGVDGADLILADLGLSSMQIDNPERGFTFKVEGPLDLRMNPSRGRSAAELLEAVNEEDLIRLLAENSDEPRAEVLAHAIIDEQRRASIRTTTGLAHVIRRALLPPSGNRRTDEIDTSIRRVFQALRIAVNDEFGALDTFLRNLPLCLKAGGRVAVLSFHSGEDRRVKKAFQTGQREGFYLKISDEVIRPGAEEIRSNPRAASAKLRWAIRSISREC
ncbi:MAG: 16S rRNA (cytosine(1402)-N(4))-methyltransferase RsmH [Pedosphaera sp.]|nr:16S rRNA (cytosine(1402)-N(4))-methyltransferase RsmH [Pedosphaera sp.]